MLLSLSLGLILSFQTNPPAALEARAKSLRRTGAKVQVGRKESGEGWELWLDHPEPADDEAFRELNGVSGLGAIRFLKGGFGDTGVAHLKNLPDLHLLVLFSDRLTDRCMDPISDLKGLVKLDLSFAKLTAVGLKKLVKLPKLRRLYLYNAKFGDSDAAELKRLKHLEILDVPGTLRKETVSQLRRALPNTTVFYRK